MDTLVLLGVLLICLIVLGMVVAIVTGNEKEKKRRAMAVIKGQSYADEKKGTPRDEHEKRRAEIAKKLKEKSNDEHKDRKKATIAVQMEQAGFAVDVKKYWIGSIILAVACFLGAKIMGGSMFVCLMALITGFFGIPRLILRRCIKKRQKKFLEEFADALEAMVRLLKAGMPITEAIAMASREFEGPVGEEMTRIYEAQKVGISMPEAALGAARRMPLTEMQMFATGLAIQAQTGASLSEVLLNLAKVIRARYRLKRKVQALSSEAKASAGIIGSLPFLVGSGLFFINPKYMDPLLFTTTGKVIMICAAAWRCVGIFIMKIMINFKV